MSNDISVADEIYKDQWNIKVVGADKVWPITKGAGAVVGVIDSGIDGSHQDLGWDSYININATMGDQAKRSAYMPVLSAIRQGLHPKILQGWNFNSNDDYTFDNYRHGTTIAGVIAAELDGIGMVGIAPEAKLRPYVVVNEYGFTTQDIAANAIMRAADDGCDVINISLAWPYFSIESPTLQDAIDYATKKGAIVVAATGNNNNNFVCYPAALNNVVSVGGCDRNGNRWVHGITLGSNYGSQITCVCPASDQPVTMYMRSRYTVAEGTSLAAANMSGIAALAKSINKKLNYQQFIDILKKSCSSTEWSETLGWGVPDALKVAEAARSFINEPPVIEEAAPNTTVILKAIDDIVAATGAIMRAVDTISNEVRGSQVGNLGRDLK